VRYLSTFGLFGGCKGGSQYVTFESSALDSPLWVSGRSSGLLLHSEKRRFIQTQALLLIPVVHRTANECNSRLLGVARPDAFQNALMRMDCSQALLGRIRCVRPAPHNRKDEQSERDNLQDFTQVFVACQIPNGAMEQDIAIVKNTNTAVLFVPCHLPDQLHQFLLRFIVQTGGSSRYGEGFERDAHLQDALVILWPEFGDLCTALLRLSHKALVFQFPDGLAQSWLANTQPIRPMLLQNAVAALQFAGKDRLT
jgi:hypothetical protein